MPFKNKKLAKKWLDQLRRDARFMTKNLRMSTFERTLDKGLLRSQLQIRNVGCEDKKAEDTKENAVLKIFQRNTKCLKAPLKLKPS